MGYLIAVLSLGRFCATLPMGYFCDKYRHKVSLLISSCVIGLGAVVWANVSLTRSLYLLYTAQFLLGVGSGSLGVTRSYVVEQVEPQHCTEMLAYLTALQYAGFTVSPIIGAALSAWGQRISPYWSFGLPAYFLALLAELSVVMLWSVFQDIDGGSSSAPAAAATAKPKTEQSNSENAKNLSRQWLTVAVLLIALNVTVRGSIAVYETLGAEIWSNDYRLNPVQLGTLVTLSGGVGSLQLVFFRYLWTSRFSEITLILIGLHIMIQAQVVMHAYGTTLPTAQQFMVSIVLMYAFGYPLAQTATLGVFSKLQKAGPQAALMSYFAAAGSLARIVIPIATGYLDKIEDNSPFLMIILMVSLSTVALLLLKSTIHQSLSPSTSNDVERAAAVPPLTLGLLINSLTKWDVVLVLLMLTLAVGSIVLFVRAL